MVSPVSRDLARRSQQLYESRWKRQLEETHRDAFVAIEPDSEQFFLGNTLTEAISAARQIWPERLVYALRVGHQAAIHLGGAR